MQRFGKSLVTDCKISVKSQVKIKVKLMGVSQFRSSYQDLSKRLKFKTKTLTSGLEIKTKILIRSCRDQDHTPRSTDQDQKFTFITLRRNSK